MLGDKRLCRVEPKEKAVAVTGFDQEMQYAVLQERFSFSTAVDVDR